MKRKAMQELMIYLCVFTLTGCSLSKDAGKTADGTTPDIPIADNALSLDENSDGNSADYGNVDENNLTAGNMGENELTAGNMKENEPVTGDELIAASDLQGSVIEFFGNGCIISPVTTTDDGNNGSSAESAAEGHEDEGEKITIHYKDNCIFQKAVMSITTGKAAVNEAAVSDIKKKTSLLLYGSFEGADNFTAAKVIIARYE